jgi:wobble nucleotide-excising tRNase
MFQDGAWNRTLPDIAIFDDRFVDENVCSGLDVASAHRQNLHELILGSQGVALNRVLAATIQQIEADNARMRAASNAIPTAERGGLSVDDFCDLPVRAEIEEAILAEERSLAASQQADTVRATPAFEALNVPDFNVAELTALLGRAMPNLDADAVHRVQEHLETIGEGGEAWVSQGMGRIHNDDCPFCAQPLNASRVLESYREYFSDEYATLKREIASYAQGVQRTHGGEVTAAFERNVRVVVQREQFWRQFTEIPELALDTAAVVRDWQSAFRAVTAVLAAKAQAPLDVVQLSVDDIAAIETHQHNLGLVAAYNANLMEADREIAVVKERAQDANVAVTRANLVRLRAVRARHTAEIAPLCTEYLAAKKAKRQTEQQRDAAKEALEQYRATAFPGYQTAINRYLARFNAGFHVDRVTSADTRGGPTCNYSLVINNAHVPVSGGAERAGEPSFKTALSAGDRNTLALAFFFAALEQDPALANKIVVIDDPVSSLDDHRMLATTQELRRFAPRIAQMIVLSHSKPFLCRLWEGTDTNARSTLLIERDGAGSTLVSWDVRQDAITEHDRRHRLFDDYRTNGPNGNSREVARSIRPHLEAYLRTACPATFPPGTLLGPFHDRCARTYGHPTKQILDQHHIDELFDLKEYSNRYHHDTNPAWETEAVNDGELLGYVGRLLTFTRP